ncbi:hypothetical protein G7Y89_g5844 [Cudoniella acicularis]|uniref:DUF4470 domain-containing protein n=1 Tax=Cudoniella acicularis TaxID=354080 RepID=A0A8H4RNC9_9HELO|nr:hypothetical protein G7Y89_g5844 [Cudoniella acicularis]
MKRPKRKVTPKISEPSPEPNPITTATTLREEGNVLYKAGKLLEACKKYQEAVKLTPNDSAPSRNLSASLYELGKYNQCIARANYALALVEREGASDMHVQARKLEQRIGKATIHDYHVSDADQRMRRLELLKELQRYRPSMFTTTEYFTVGHDVVTSLFDGDILNESKLGLESVSFFFGGAGDARNVLQTIIDVADQENTKQAPHRTYHFTVNDIAKSSIARNLIIWMLLEDLSHLDMDSYEGTMILNTIFFIYMSTMMPAYAFEQLNQTIERALDALRNEEQPLKWLYLHHTDIPQYSEALRDWQGKARDIFTSKEIIDKVAGAMLFKTDAEYLQPSEAVFLKERKLYLGAAVLFPAQEILDRQDPTMAELIQNSRSSHKEKVSLFKKHLQENWHFNTTLMDVDWCKDLPRKRGEFDVSFDPFESVRHFPTDEMVMKPRNPNRLFDHFAPLFKQIAKSIKFLRGRMQVEALLGDYVDVTEKIQFGLYADAGSAADGEGVSQSRPETFPTLYDRVHLSNVPDYMGGHLSTFLYAMPLLRRCLSSYVKANCLRNSSSFNTVLDYLSEYQLITNDSQLQQLAQVRIRIRENNEITWPMADYSYYVWAQASPNSFSQLMPRAEFTKWFYGLFFRLTLPFQQQLLPYYEVIFSPLNLTILFRLIPHMVSLGYPAHWLSEVLNNIISNHVLTTARPPRTKPMRAIDIDRPHPLRKLCTAPFSYELATLAQLFQPLLPFLPTLPQPTNPPPRIGINIPPPRPQPQRTCLHSIQARPTIRPQNLIPIPDIIIQRDRLLQQRAEQ